MKRLLLMSVLTLFMHATLWAFEVDGINYSISGSNVSVSSGSYSGEVIIPETVTYEGNTYTVTSIGGYAFRGCTGLTEITIPEGVTEIGESAFYKCTGLTQVNFNAIACTTVGGNINGGSGRAFYGCTNISRVNIGDNVTIIPAYMFYGCTALTELTIPSSVTSIGNYAFYNCTWLAEINFNATNCSVSSNTFSGCTSISKITIGNNVTLIPANLFSKCTGLTEITIPSNVTEIANSAFSGCTGIEEVFYNATACTSAGSSSSPVFDGCTNLAKITMGDNVTTIPANLFYKCTGLTGITIPNMVAKIGNSAFYGCTGLTEVNYNATACTSAGSSSSPVFSGCTNVVNLIIGENVTTIPEYTFHGCTSLTDITMLGGTPPTIYGTTFANVTDVAVPKEALNKYALADIWTDIPRIYANSNGNVYYPVPISYKGAAAIIAAGGDENGTEALAGSTVQFSTIEGNNLSYGLATHIAKDITEELINTGSYSLTVSEYHKENTVCCYSPEGDNLYDITVWEAGQVLNEITVSKINTVYSLKVTGDINGTDIVTIRRMTNLTMLDLSDANVVSGGSEYYDTYRTSDNQIGSYFFYDMASLKTVVLPSNITSIGSYAFGNCTDLTVITIPESVTSVANDAFSGCTSLAIVTLEDGVNTMSLSTSAFNKCPIATLHVGRKLNYSSTSSLPFANLATLSTLTIGDEVESVINSEYYGCSGLASLTIGDWVTSVGSSAFYGCSSLTEATIGSRVETIGSNAFSGGVSLAVINSKNPTPPDIESNTFNNVNKETCVLNIPTGSLNDYWLDRYWGEFLNINDNLPNGIRDIVTNGNAEAVSYYTLDGKQVPTLQKGVNIIRYSDGTAKKVLVK